MRCNDRARPVASLDLTEAKTARKVNLASGIIAILLAMLFGIRLSALGQSPYWILLVAFLLIPTTFVHEILHYLFQWLFSRSKPSLGFKFPFPYSALAPNTYITRNQGMFCALAPFIFITPILVLASLLMSPLVKELFWAWASLEAATCVGDFLAVSWLFRYPRYLKLANVNLSNVLFDTTQAGEHKDQQEKGL